ncbi:MAG: hypothetical protein WD184_04130 [Acidimicrobiia bacterium]
MSTGTTPAILLHELFSGDGPHGEQADRFVAGSCIRCGEAVVADDFLTRSGEAAACGPCRASG